MVVYHLHGQTSQFKVCANGMQNPGLGKFLLESHLAFEQIISISHCKSWHSTHYLTGHQDVCRVGSYLGSGLGQ